MIKSEDKSEKTFWQTVPGIIAAIAALITAIGGCIAIVFGIPAISNAVFGVTPTPIISQTTYSPKVYVLDSGMPTLTKSVGGSGGEKFEPRKCPAMAVANGIVSQSNVYINQIKLLCQQLNQDGSMNDDSETFKAGGDDSEPFKAVVCSQNYFIVGITGRSGTFIDYIGSIKCSDVDGHSEEISVNAGGSGGGNFEVICPQGYAVTGFGGRFGTHIDQLFLFCTLIRQQ